MASQMMARYRWKFPLMMGMMVGMFLVFSASDSDEKTKDIECQEGSKVFSPNGDGHFDTAKISLRVNWKSSREVRVEVRDQGGKLVSAIFTGSLKAGLYEYSWDGRGLTGLPCPVGAYKFVILTDAKGGSIYREYRVWLDLEGPKVEDIAPAPWAMLKDNRDVSLSAEIRGRHSDIESTSFYVDGNFVGKKAGDHPSIRMKDREIAMGRHTLRIEARDGVYNTTRIDSVFYIGSEEIVARIAGGNLTQYTASLAQANLELVNPDDAHRISDLVLAVKTPKETLRRSLGTNLGGAISVSKLLDGTYELFFEVKDKLGVVYKTPSQVLVKDVSSPVVSSPLLGHLLVTNQSSLSLSLRVLDLSPTEVTLAGVRISETTPGDYTGRLELTEGSNHFSIGVTDAAGNGWQGSADILLDTMPPQVTRLEPGDGALFDHKSVSVSASVTEANLAQITLSQTPGNFLFTNNRLDPVFPVTLSEGTNGFILNVLDYAGNLLQVNRQFVLDTVPPDLRITSPVGRFVTREDSLLISGEVFEANFLSLTVAGENVPLLGQMFAHSTPLSEGSSEISVIAKDLVGHTTEKKVLVVKDTIAPQVTFSDGSTYTNGSANYTLRAHVTDSTAVICRDSGSNISLPNGDLVLPLVLSSGDNYHDLVFVDEAGNETTEHLKFYFDNIAPDANTTLRTAQNLGIIRVLWEDNKEEDVASYVVRRSPDFPDNFPGANASHEVVLPRGSRQVLDSIQGPLSFTYSLKAVDRFGNTSGVTSVLMTPGKAVQVVEPGRVNTLEFQEMTLTVPLGAVGVDKVFSVEVLTNAKTEEFRLLSQIYHLEPSGATFPNPIEATFAYDPTKLPKGYRNADVRVFTRANASSPWGELTVTSRSDTGRVTALLPHFSDIAVGFEQAATESQTRQNVNTHLPGFSLPNPLDGRMTLRAPSPGMDGTLNQSIPVTLPPGRAGNTPSLSVGYSSDNGQGTMGIGWYFGLESITRSASGRGLPSFDDTKDQFSFGGQRLVFVKNALRRGTIPYREYRLQKEGSFARFELYQSGTLESYWLVVKDGVEIAFGSRGDSRVLGKSLTGVTGNFAWNVSEQKKAGDTVSYYYLTLPGGFTVPDHIDYSGFRVSFNYFDRQVPFAKSVASGFMRQLTHLLTEITVVADPTSPAPKNVSTMQFTYDPDNCGNYLLSRVRTFLRDNTSADDILDFTYYDSDYRFESTPTVMESSDISEKRFRHRLVDFNGDGTPDVLAFRDGLPGRDSKFNLYSGNGSGFSFAHKVNLGSPSDPKSADGTLIEKIFYSDVDGDGLPDAVVRERGSDGFPYLDIFTNNGTDFVLGSHRKITIPTERVFIADFDGDGRADYVENLHGYNGENRHAFKVYTNEGASFAPPERCLTFGLETRASSFAISGERFFLLDMNGDGKADAVFEKSGYKGLKETRYEVYFNTGSGFLPEATTFRIPNTFDRSRLFLRDINGDSLPDLAISLDGLTWEGVKKNGRVLYFENQLTGFSTSGKILSGPDTTLDHIDFVDVNRDGQLDMVVDFFGDDSKNGQADVWLNDHGNFFKESTIDLGIRDRLSLSQLSQFDMDGDGLPDFVQTGAQGLKKMKVWKQVPKYARRLKTASFHGALLTYQYGRVKFGMGRSLTLYTGYRAENRMTDVSAYSENGNFKYAGFKVDRQRGVFYGFKTVSTVDALGNESRTTYRQDDEPFAGQVEKTENFVKVGTETRQVSFSTSTLQVISNVHGVYNCYVVLPTQSFSVVTDPYSGARLASLSATEYLGEENLFLPLRSTTYHRVDPDTKADLDEADNSSEEFAYSMPNSDGADLNMLPRIGQSTSFMTAPYKLLSKSRVFYDNLSWGAVGALGLPTAKEEWAGGETYFRSENTYSADAPYLLLKQKNLVGTPRQTEITFTYDDTQRFATGSANSWGNYGRVWVDPIWGLPLKTEDTWGQFRYFRYDRLNRLIATYGPKDLFDPNLRQIDTEVDDILASDRQGIDKASSLVKFALDPGQIHYTLLLSRKFSRDTFLPQGENPFIETSAFVDGLARQIQTKIRKSQSEVVVSGKVVLDPLGRMTERHEPEVDLTGNMETYFAGRIGSRNIEKTEYDALGRVVSQGRVNLDDGRQILTRTYFDGPKNIYVVDPKGNIKEAVYDDKGQVVRRIDYRGQVRSPESVYATIDYLYDRLGLLTDTVDPASRTIHIEYNELGQKVKMVDPDLGTLTYAYNVFGELTNQIDAKLQVTKFTYDDRGRVTNKEYTNAPGMEPVDYTYGTNGISLDRLVSVEDGSGKVTYDYDITGAVIQVNRTIGISTWHTGYDHDNLGRIRELSYPAQDGQTPFVLNYFYNPHSGLLDNIQGGGQTFLAGINYDHFGRRVSMTYGNHVQTDMEYESLTMRLTTQAIKQVNGTLLANTEYSFDSVGNVTRKNEKVEGRVNDYAYDDMNRLVRSTFSTPDNPASTSAYDEYFTYGAEGNIWSKDANAPVGATRGNRGYQYKPGTHQVTSYTGEVGTDFNSSFTFDYDQNGNRTKKTVRKSDNSLAEDWEYTYDAENRLTQVKNLGAVKGTYIYDDSGERVSKTTSDGTTTLYIDGLSQEVISGGVKYFIFDGLNRIALFQKLNSTATVGKTFFLHTDHVGSISVVTGGDGSTLGNVTERLEYKAFGSMFENWSAAEGWTACPSNLSDLGGIGFTGQELDGENNLLYMGARYLDPHSGRFMIADTIIDGETEPEGYNRYSCVHNNPINYNDPSGHIIANKGDPTGHLRIGESLSYIASTTGVQWGFSLEDLTKINPKIGKEEIFKTTMRINLPTTFRKPSEIVEPKDIEKGENFWTLFPDPYMNWDQEEYNFKPIPESPLGTFIGWTNGAQLDEHGRDPEEAARAKQQEAESLAQMEAVMAQGRADADANITTGGSPDPIDSSTKVIQKSPPPVDVAAIRQTYGPKAQGGGGSGSTTGNPGIKGFVSDFFSAAKDSAIQAGIAMAGQVGRGYLYSNALAVASFVPGGQAGVLGYMVYQEVGKPAFVVAVKAYSDIKDAGGLKKFIAASFTGFKNELMEHPGKVAGHFAINAILNAITKGKGSGKFGIISGKGSSQIWRDLKVFRGQTKTNGLKGNRREYYEWDYTHNEIEVYNNRGVHKGVMDSITGEMIKPPVIGRTIDI